MKNKAFTLIELLVVIAIIGILSTVVIASLNGARDKAKSAALKSEVRQLFNLAMEHYAETGDFTTFATHGWVHGDFQDGESSSGAPCSTRIRVTAKNRDKAIEICNSIASKLPKNLISNTRDNKLILSCNGGTCVDRKYQFSVNVKLTDNEYNTGADAGNFFCIGSSGATYEGLRNNNAAGCYSNP